MLNKKGKEERKIDWLIHATKQASDDREKDDVGKGRCERVERQSIDFTRTGFDRTQLDRRIATMPADWVQAGLRQTLGEQREARR
jgi:hypothetical protein